MLRCSCLPNNMASWRDLQEEIKEGLQERQNKDRGLNSKRQALMGAIRKQHVEKVERLLNQGVDPNFRDGSGDYPLHVACSYLGDDNNSSAAELIVELLVYVGADLAAHDRFSQQPLHIAASNCHRAVRLLLEKGCSVNTQDNAGCTALMAACRNNDHDLLDTVTLLLQYNANVHLADDQGFTALHSVCQNCKVDTAVRNQVALLLLNAGASALTCDYEGRMALCYELDKLTMMTYRNLPYVSLDLVHTLMCGGANLQPSSRTHQYWVRYVANTASPKILSTLLHIIAPVLTRPSLHLISKTVKELCPDSTSEDGTSHLKTQVRNLCRSMDSLQSICRLTLRGHLRGKLLVAVPRLPLPNKLKHFLTSLDRTCS